MLTIFGGKRRAWLSLLGVAMFSTTVSASTFGFFRSMLFDSDESENEVVLIGTEMAPLNVHAYAQALSHRLFAGLSPKEVSLPIVVSSFVDVATLSVNPTARDPLAMLGLQLEESFITLASEQGFRVAEGRMRTALAMMPDQTQALSRDYTRLAKEIELGYFLTGTVTRQQDGATVNARLVDVSNNAVISAVTGFIPNNVFQDQQHSQWYNGRLYRNEYPTEGTRK